MGEKGSPVLGSRIRALRRAHGWTQAQLATRVQVTATYISMLERGRETHATSPVLGRLATALSISLADLVDETRPLEADGLALAANSDREFQRLVKAWARIRPALRPHLVELANTLATISMMLDTGTDPDRGLPPAAAVPENTPHA